MLQVIEKPKQTSWPCWLMRLKIHFQHLKLRRIRFL
jgi:hypothetical protein